MLGFSIMMWFVSFIVCIVAISLLRGNTASLHGKVFDKTEDKVGYGKALGKPLVFMSIGVFICGLVAVLVKTEMAIVYALIVLLTVVIISAMWFILIQKKYK